MSTVVSSKGHRHTQSAASPSQTALSKNPQNPHHLNEQSHPQNSHSEMSDSYQSNPTTPPRTPRRNDQFSQNRTTADNGSKQKSRTKNRPKNVMTSPAVIRKGRNTPPLTGAQSGGMPSSAKPTSTPSNVAYAGPTFHASPAPSALPIPSFYSKSVPDVSGMKVFKPKDDSFSDSPTPPLPALNSPSQQKILQKREESPLDIFFKADKEQKARAKSASSFQNTVTTNGPFNPPHQSSRVSQTPPVTGSQHHTGHNSKTSPSTIFAIELDGEGSNASPIGPAFSTPYAERINAARPRQKPSLEAQSALDKSEALKAYLFSGQQPPFSSASPINPFSTTSSPPSERKSPAAAQNSVATLHSSKSDGYAQRSHQHSFAFSHDSKPTNYAPRTSGRNSGLRQEVTPTRTPTKTLDRDTGYSTSPKPSRRNGSANSSDSSSLIGNNTSQTSPQGVASGDRSADIKGMEDSLRKILKLDPTGSSGAGAAVSSPNHGGGSAPPMNGMQDGVMGS